MLCKLSYVLLIKSSHFYVFSASYNTDVFQSSFREINRKIMTNDANRIHAKKDNSVIILLKSVQLKE